MDVYNTNLNDLTELICHDGIFDSFNDSALTDSQFQNNIINGGSGVITQSGGEVIFTPNTSAGYYLEACKYQNDIVLTPNRSLPWPIYIDYVLETRVKISNTVNIAGVALSFGDSSIILKVGIGTKPTTGVTGVRVGLGTTNPVGYTATVDYVNAMTIATNTYYNLVVQLKYNYLALSDNTSIAINAWLDGTKILDNYKIDRSLFDGNRIDGKVGLVAEVYTGLQNGIVTFDYFCSNRLMNLINYQYRLTTLHKIGDFKANSINIQSEDQMKIGKESLLTIYARNSTSDSWQKRWDGFIDDIILPKDNEHNLVTSTASHYSKLLDQRSISTNYSDQTTDFIIKDSTYGIIPLKASDLITTNNVQSGVYTLTEIYTMNKLRRIILELSAEEDYLPWLDESHDLNFKAINTLIDTGLSYSVGDGKLLDHKIDEIGMDQYTGVEVYGQGADLSTDSIHLIYKLANSSHLIGGERNRVLIIPRATTQDEAIRKARQFLLNNEPLLIGTIKVLLDYTITIGSVITLTLTDEALGIQNRQFIVLEILENPTELTQTLSIAESSSGIADLLYENFLQTQTMDNRDGNSSAPESYAVQLDVTIGVRIDYLVEYSTDGKNWSTHESGKATVTQRGIAIETASIGNEATSSTPIDGNFNNGLVFKIGTGNSNPKIEDTDLTTDLAINKTVAPVDIQDVNQNGNAVTKASAIWSTSEANDNAISEAGFYEDMQAISYGTSSINQYATISKWAPYNVPTQLHCHAVLQTPFNKTSSNYLKITFTITHEFAPFLKRRI